MYSTYIVLYSLMPCRFTQFTINLLLSHLDKRRSTGYASFFMSTFHTVCVVRLTVGTSVRTYTANAHAYCIPLYSTVHAVVTYSTYCILLYAATVSVGIL